MALRFARSAGRHGIRHERAAYVIEHCPLPLFAGPMGPPASILFLGPDANGVPLEVLAIELPDGELLVIHAMRMRRKYLETYAEGMSWHDR